MKKKYFSISALYYAYLLQQDAKQQKNPVNPLFNLTTLRKTLKTKK